MILFSTRLLAVLHLLNKLESENLDYTETGAPIEKTHIPYHQMYQFYTLPTQEELPEYYKIIQHPMTFQIIWFKASTLQYTCLSQFVADIRLVFANCHKFNQKGSLLTNLAKQLEKTFDQQLDCFFDEEDRAKAAKDAKAGTHELGAGLFDVLSISDQFTQALRDF